MMQPPSVNRFNVEAVYLPTSFVAIGAEGAIRTFAMDMLPSDIGNPDPRRQLITASAAQQTRAFSIIFLTLLLDNKCKRTP